MINLDSSLGKLKRTLAGVGLLALLPMPGLAEKAPSASEKLSTPSGPIHQMNEGLAVIEAEAAAVTGQWEARGEKAGFSGTGYYYWTGPNLYDGPDDSVLSYTLNVPEAGVYRLHLRTLRDMEGREVREDLENDVWVRVNQKGWIKTYFRGPWAQWDWTNNFDFAHYTGLRPAPEVRLGEGLNTIDVAGRSERVRFDLLIVQKADLDFEAAKATIDADALPPEPN